MIAAFLCAGVVLAAPSCSRPGGVSSLSSENKTMVESATTEVLPTQGAGTGTDTAGSTTATAKTPGKPNPSTGKTNPKDTTARSEVTRATTDPSSKYLMKLVAEKQTVDILREDGDATRRLVYLRFTNNEGITHKGLTFTWTENGKKKEREIADITFNYKVILDTLWVPVGQSSVTGRLTNGSGKTLWEGTIKIEPAPRAHTIKKTTVYGLKDIKTMTLRGVNYYPRQTPWSAWTGQDPAVWDAEFKEISALNVNAIRTQSECWETDRKLGACATPEYLETISKLFETASKYGIKTLLCLHSGMPSQVPAENLRYVRSIVETFQNDGRVLGWDLINEIDAFGLLEHDYIDEFCLTMYPRLSEFDPNHLNNIGFAYMLDKPVQLGLTFNGPNQCWQYHFYRKFTTDSVKSYYDKYFNKRPFMIGEFGDTSLEGACDGPPRPDTGEDWQLEVYQAAIPAGIGTIEAGIPLLGMFAWTAFDYPTMMGQLPAGQGEYGLIRPDGSLKPAAEYLAAEYGKLKKSNPAHWDK